MKNIIVIMSLLICGAVSAQDKVYKEVDTNAEPEGGIASYYETLGKNLKYPEAAAKEKLEGTVFIELIIDKDGEIIKSSVAKGFNKACDEAALKAVVNSGKWKPGMLDGNPVKQQLVLPVKFSLESEKKHKKG